MVQIERELYLERNFSIFEKMFLPCSSEIRLFFASFCFPSFRFCKMCSILIRINVFKFLPRGSTEVVSTGRFYWLVGRLPICGLLQIRCWVLFLDPSLFNAMSRLFTFLRDLDVNFSSLLSSQRVSLQFKKLFNPLLKKFMLSSIARFSTLGSVCLSKQS